MHLKSLRHINWLPLFVGAISLAITLLLWQAMLIQRDASITRFTQLAAKSVRSEIANRLLFQVNSLTRMAKRWENRKEMPESEWREDATAHVAGYIGYRAVEWVDSAMRVRWVVPEVGNEKVEGLKADFDTQRKAVLEKAELTKAVVMSSIIELIQGDRGFLIYVPMFINNQSNGFILGVVDLQKFLDDVLSEHLAPGYNMQILQNDQVMYERMSDPQPKKQYEEEELLSLYGTQWHIHVWPGQILLAESRSILPEVLLVVGLIITALLMFIIQFSQMTNQQAREIIQANQDLQKEINEREQAEQAKDKMKKALLQSQKMQAVGTLAGGIAHDFNNILYSMIGYVDMARDDVEPDTLIYDNLSKVISVGQRGQELVSRLLSFSRQQQHAFKPISLQEVLSSTLVLLKPTLPASIAILQNNSIKGQDIVLGGHTELQQVLVNIMSNAVDAIDDQGTISINIYRQTADDDFRQRFPKLRKSAYFVIEITDNGHGIPPQVLARVFEPFYTTKEVGKGTGLGLATALGIVHDHDGEMTIESIQGQGTKVFIYLPEYQTKEE